MGKSTLSTLLLCAALAAPLSAGAQARADGSASYGNLSYTYADGRIVLFDPDGGDNLDGFRLGGSLQFRTDLFAVGSITAVGDTGYDLTVIDLGVGLRHPLSSATDFVAIGGIVLAEVDAGPFDDDDTGISLTGGVRSMMSPQFELAGYANYADYLGDGDILLTGEALMHVTPELSLAASLGISDDYDVVTLGARWNFRGTRR
jgi:hypothetical protein